MRIALFVPCYIEQFYPEVAVATYQLLKKLGCEVDYPLAQTCCGQPMANSGFENYSRSTMELFVKNFSGYDYVVAPSGSCVLFVREHCNAHPRNNTGHGELKIYELCEFLTDVIKVKSVTGCFPYKVGLHEGCHGLRGLRLAQDSEMNVPYYSKVRPLLEMVDGLQLVNLNRADECCGFGGSFCVAEEAVSVKMGNDRVKDHELSGAQVITSTDMSCLMHLQGIIKREKKPIQVLHIAQILNSE